MCVRDLLGSFQVGAHELDAVLPADRPVERSARCPAFASELKSLPEQRPAWGEGSLRVLDLVHAPPNASD
jgi:hypothetical protein